MSDVVVTIPRSFGLLDWIDEGDVAGEPWSGEEWDFYLAGMRPAINPGERVYVVYNGALRGYAPLIRLETKSYFVRRRGPAAFSLVRGGGAVAVTIPEFIRGFRGWRYRWWDRCIEVSFPDWQNPNALPECVTRPVSPSRTSRPKSAPSHERMQIGMWEREKQS